MRYLSMVLLPALIAGTAMAVSTAKTSPSVNPKTAGTISYICVARSVTGKRYSAEDPDQAKSQELALEKCEASSWRCYPTGCTPTTD